ncbi:hypothetical protein ACLOJK_030218 [Asimina triloba]
MQRGTIKLELEKRETIVVTDMAASSTRRRILIIFLAAAPPFLPIRLPSAGSVPFRIPSVDDDPAAVAPFPIDPLVRWRQRERPSFSCTQHKHIISQSTKFETPKRKSSQLLADDFSRYPWYGRGIGRKVLHLKHLLVPGGLSLMLDALIFDVLVLFAGNFREKKRLENGLALPPLDVSILDARKAATSQSHLAESPERKKAFLTRGAAGPQGSSDRFQFACPKLQKSFAETLGEREAGMDFSALRETIASKSYDKIADLCDDLLLQACYFSFPISRNNARFLWKSIPKAIKESKPEIVAAWKIGQHLWKRDYAGVHEAIRGYEWSPEVEGLVTALSGKFFLACLSILSIWVSKNLVELANNLDKPEDYTTRIFQLLTSAYSTISIADTAHFLGMREEDVTNYALRHGWSVDPAASMFTVKKQHVVKEQKLDPSKLQRLTEYVFHLEH